MIEKVTENFLFKRFGTYLRYQDLEELNKSMKARMPDNSSAS